MTANRYASALATGLALTLGVVSLESGALAADMPVKAPPAPATPFVLDVHGFFDTSFKNDYITPRGLLVTNTGLTTQVLSGLVLDIYKDKMGFINDVSIYAGVWNDLWSKQHDPHVGPWNEFDWFTGVDIKFAQNWKFGVQYIEFLPPAADLITSFPRTERNVEFSLSYDDSWVGWPIAFHPYAKLFYAAEGPSTVVLGKGGDTFDVELGAVPTLDTQKYTGIPLVLTAPTWVTVGPTDYWNRNDGTTNFCGPASDLACPLSNTGVVSTGLTGKLAIDSVIPKRLGSWYIDAGVQYYHILNDALLAAQIFTGAAGGAANVLGTFPNSHRDVVVGFAGFGFGF